MAKVKLRDVIVALEQHASPQFRQGMANYGIKTDRALGVSIVDLRGIAKKLKRDHQLAKQLWSHDMHEARILGSLLAEPNLLTLREVDEIVKHFDSWDIVDQYCANLFRHSKLAESICFRYVDSKDEFAKRTSFSMMAVLAAHRENNWSDAKFLKLLPLIKKHSSDDRKYVMRSVNWALRQIGKRSPALRQKALVLAQQLAASDDASQKWIGRDAVKELSRKGI